MSLLLRSSGKIIRNWPANLADEDISDFAAGRENNTLNVYLEKYSNVWVSADSVFYKNGLLIKASLPTPEYIAYYRFKHLAKKLLRAKKVKLSKHLPYLLITDSWSIGHFHWFCDVLPKLLALGPGTGAYTLLLPDHPYIHEVAIESLSLLGVSFAGIIFMKEDEFYKAPDLVFINKVAPCGQMDNELMSKMRIKMIGDKPPGEKNIYISRATAKYRKVINEKELYPLLNDYGYEIVMTEGMKLQEQIDLFSSCNTILGIHGAGLTNCIFMPPGGNVAELKIKESASKNGMYWQLADSLGHRYFYYNGRPDSNLPLMGNGCNLEISLRDIEDKVLRKIPGNK